MAIVKFSPIQDSTSQSNWLAYPSTSDHYLRIDDTTSTSYDDTDYIYVTGGLAYKTDRVQFTLDTITSGDTINSVTVRWRYYRDDNSGNSPQAKCLLYSGGSDYYGSNESTVGAWTDVYTTWTTNPNTSAAWTFSEIDNSGTYSPIQFGMRTAVRGSIPKSGDADFHTSNIYIEIDYSTGGTEGTDRLPCEAELTGKPALIRLANEIDPRPIRKERLANTVEFEPPAVGGAFPPTDDGSLGSEWLKSGGSTFYELVDDPVGERDEDSTYAYITLSDAHFDDVADDASSLDLKLVSDASAEANEIVPRGFKLDMYITGRKSSNSNGSFYVEYRNATDGDGSWYRSASVINFTVTGYEEKVVTFTEPGWAGDWGKPKNFEWKLMPYANTSSNGEIRITQTYLDFYGFEKVERIANAADTIVDGEKTRCANAVEWAPYDPEWWDTNYKRRYQINFGTTHSELPVDYTPEVEFITGFEQIVAEDGVSINEGIQHSSRQIARVDDGTYDYTYVTWIGYPDKYKNNMWVYLRRYDHSTETWGTAKALFDSGTSFDTHYAPSLLVDGSGYVHLFYGCHHTPCKYARSGASHDIDNWLDKTGSITAFADNGSYVTVTSASHGLSNGDKVQISETSGYHDDSFTISSVTTNTFDILDTYQASATTGIWHELIEIGTHMTYPKSVEDKDGNIYVIGRHMNIPTESYLDYYKSDDNGATWSSQNKIIHYNDADVGPGSIYTGGVVYRNGRIHIAPQFTDIYGTTNYGIGMGYIYSDDWTNWYEAGGSSPISVTNGDEPSNVLAGFTEITRVVSSAGYTGNPSTDDQYPDSRGTNSEGITVDLANNPILIYSAYDGVITDGVDIGFSHFDGSSWTETIISELAGAKAIISGRQGCHSITRGNEISIYGFGHPSDITEEYFGAELFRWRTYNNGSTWSFNQLTENTGGGLGMMSVNPVTNSGNTNELVMCRGNKLYYLQDKAYPYVKVGGDDVRIVKQKQTWNGSIVTTNTDTYDRLSDRFGGEDTKLYFKLDQAVPANEEHPHPYTRYWVYTNYTGVSATPAHDPDNVWLNYEGFEEYATAYDITGQSAWSKTHADITGKVVGFWDTTTYPLMATNRLYSGAKSLGILKSTSASDESLDWDLGSYLTDIILEMYVWVDTNNVNIELHDTSGATWYNLRVTGTDMWYTDSAPTSLTKIDDITDGQMHKLQFKITSSGLTIFLDGVEIETNNSEVTQVDKIEFSGFNTNAGTIDSLKIYKVVATEPTITTVTVAGENTSTIDFTRIGNIADPVHQRDTRLPSDLDMWYHRYTRVASNTVLEFSEVVRVAQVLTPDKHEAERLAQIISGDKELLERLANVLEAVKGGKERLPGDVVLEAEDSLRLAQVLAGDKKFLARLSSTSDMSLIDLNRLANVAVQEAVSLVRVANLLSADKSFHDRLASQVMPDSEEFLRVMNVLDTDEELLKRVANIADKSKDEFERLAADLNLDKELFTRVCQIVLMEADDITRIANNAEVHYSRVVQIAHQVVSDKEVTIRFAHTVPITPTGDIRLANLVGASAENLLRLMNTIESSKKGIVRVANILDPEKTFFEKLPHMLEMSSSDIHRLANIAFPVVVAQERISQLVDPYKSELIRLVNDLDAVKDDIARFASDIDVQKSDLELIANALDVEQSSVYRLAQVAEMEADNLLRVAQLVDLEYMKLDRLASLITPSKIQTMRLMNLAAVTPSGDVRLANTVVQEAFARKLVAMTVDIIKDELLKLAGDVEFDAEKLERVANNLGVSASDLLRIANEVTPLVEARFRVSQLVEADKEDFNRLVNALETHKTLFDKIPNTLDVSKEDMELLANALDCDAQTIIRLSQVAEMSQDNLARIAQYAELAHLETKRLAQLVTPSKLQVIRLSNLAAVTPSGDVRVANLVAVEAIERIRLASALDLSKIDSTRLHNDVVSDKEFMERFANMVGLNVESVLRVCSDLDLSKQSIDRMTSTLGADRRDISRVASTLDFSIYSIVRLANNIISSRSQVSRLSADAELAVTMTDRLANLLDFSTINYARVACWADTEAMDFTRLGMVLELEKEDMLRLSNVSTMTSYSLMRIANALLSDEENILRVASTLGVSDTALKRTANKLQLESLNRIRLANELGVSSSTVSRTAHDMDLEKNATLRLACILLFASFPTGLKLTNVTIDTLKLVNETLATLGLTVDVDCLKLEDVDIKDLKFNNTILSVPKNTDTLIE